MFRIAICDDDCTICSFIENTILDFKHRMKEMIEIEIFYSGEEFYRDLVSGTYYDLVFLDIELKLLSGIQVGKKIRDELKNDITQIVYISAKDSYAMELFEVRPMHFLVKPLKVDKINSVITKGMELSDKLGQVFQYKIGRRIVKKPVRDILYFESMDRQVRMITIDGNEIFYGSLKDIYKQVEKFNFIYCHKSYLINYNHIIEFQYESLTMSDKTILPIS